MTIAFPFFTPLGTRTGPWKVDPQQAARAPDGDWLVAALLGWECYLGDRVYLFRKSVGTHHVDPSKVAIRGCSLASLHGDPARALGPQIIGPDRDTQSSGWSPRTNLALP